MTNDVTRAASLHVLVAGGGLAGLATAQGLLKAGHTVEVFERDADLDRKQGYYLHFNAIGGEALRRVLPDDLFELYLDTSRESFDRMESIVLERPARGAELAARHVPAAGRPAPAHRRAPPDAAPGAAARAWATRCTPARPWSRFEQDADGVTVTLADGRTARGDVLVGADGIRSAVRTQYLPERPGDPDRDQGDRRLRPHADHARARRADARASSTRAC